MIRVKLREALAVYEERTGVRLTYGDLAKSTGLAPSTVESMASRAHYNASLRSIAKLCAVLECSPGELLSLEYYTHSPEETGR